MFLRVQKEKEIYLEMQEAFLNTFYRKGPKIVCLKIPQQTAKAKAKPNPIGNTVRASTLPTGLCSLNFAYNLLRNLWKNIGQFPPGLNGKRGFDIS